jgi:pimeloyl-ACP methyl ester carboxylesterase
VSPPDRAVREQEWRIATGRGRIFAKTWTPGADEAAGRASIVLFHDSLGCVDLWRGFPRLLATTAGRRVLAYDRLGFGRSDPHPGRLPPDFIAAEARQVPLICDEIGITGLVACGHSVGGAMAVEAAAWLPRRCRAVVTIAAQAFVEDRTLAGIRRAEGDFTDPAKLARLSRYHGDKARWVADAWIGTWLAPAFAAWTLDAALAAMQCPVLAIHGDADEYGSVEHARRIADGRGTAHVLRGAGHVPHREGEGVVVDLILEFLAANRA